ncbi:CAP domain-containing protein [Oceanobacillus halophilus]|uniref:SCP domain-containing protein n=1 Tax=Oceanobacillus halophilus TaxID=930130 RepID=A0A495A4V9_9BACI|nr:CAP domain-containing protein [Oceanobacillus halophilus]RKQ34682.1 hypothetical protein D8M06_07110 [Oceanobacillus halophilus]
MKNHIKWLLALFIFPMILMGCANEEGARNNNDTGNPNDFENVSFGPNENQENNGRTDNDFPLFDGNTEDRGNYQIYRKEYRFGDPNRVPNDQSVPDDERLNPGQQAPTQPNPTSPETNQSERNNNTPQEGNQAADASEIVKEVVRLTNEERKKNGLPELQMSQELNDAAQKKSVDMADNGYFSHNSPTYGSPFDMLKQFGIDYTVAAENIAAGQQTAQEVVDGWMNSEGHRKNILNDSVTHIGVGMEDSGNQGPYWTQLFIAK